MSESAEGAAEATLSLILGTEDPAPMAMPHTLRHELVRPRIDATMIQNAAPFEYRADRQQERAQEPQPLSGQKGVVRAMGGSIQRQRLCLQFVMAIACLIPIAAGLAGALMGSGSLERAGIGISEDSQFRYLSGLLLAIGLCFLSLVPKIERATSGMRLLTFIVIIGGLARLAGVATMGFPSRPMLGGLAMELAVTPLLCLWQTKLAERYRAEKSLTP